MLALPAVGVDTVIQSRGAAAFALAEAPWSRQHTCKVGQSKVGLGHKSMIIYFNNNFYLFATLHRYL